MARIIKFSKTNAAVLKAKPDDILPDGFKSTAVIDDIRFQFVFEFNEPVNGAMSKTLNCFVSYKKHLAESYTKADDYRPTSARNSNANTICGLSEADFIRAFDDYGTFLGYEMTGKQVDTMNPSGFQYNTSAYGVSFTNNNDRFGKPFHCFPTIPARSLSPKAVDLTGEQLQDFCTLMKFLAFNGRFADANANGHVTRRAAARKHWATYNLEPWFFMLVSPVDRARLDALLKDNALDVYYAQLRSDEGEAKKKANLALAKK